MKIEALDVRIIDLLRRWYVPVARLSLFIIFFWFGLLKLLALSPAGPLAQALVDKTVGQALFDPLFMILALIECVIGLLFLVPRATRIVIPLLFVHMGVVCAPLVLVPEFTWQGWFVPTLEGQYIIKNVVVIAVAIGIAASVAPLANRQK